MVDVLSKTTIRNTRVIALVGGNDVRGSEEMCVLIPLPLTEVFVLGIAFATSQRDFISPDDAYIFMGVLCAQYFAYPRYALHIDIPLLLCGWIRPVLQVAVA